MIINQSIKKHGIKPKRIVVGISGASGALYGIRLLEILTKIDDVEPHLVISNSAKLTIELETNYTYEQVTALATHHYDIDNIAASISSGSFKTDGMIIVPCSIKTLSGIANSYSDNLLIRAADVTLKERRNLILCVRETPFHTGHLQLMLKATQIGATIMPLIPAFYHMPKTIDDLICQSLARVLEQFNIETNIYLPWSEN